MSYMLRAGVLAVVLLAGGAGSANADWWGLNPYSSNYSYYPSYSSWYGSRYAYYPSYSSYYPSYTSYYPSYYSYYPAYSYYPVAAPTYYYVQPATYACPTPAVQVPISNGPYAQPVPAPASTQEPPLIKKMDPPPYTESRSFYLSDCNTYTTSSSGNSTAVTRVGFWNITGRDVTLIVNGTTYSIGRDRNVTLSLGRMFTWQIDGRDAQTERLADTTNNHEIVLR